MNKKLIVLILFIFLLLSTVAISLLGKKPDPPIVRVDTVTFIPNEGDKYSYVDDELVVVIDINDLEKTDGKYVITYQLNCVISPIDAANKIILYNLFSTNYKEYVEISSTGFVTITLDSKQSMDFEFIAKSADDAVNAVSKIKISLFYKGTDNPW